MIAQREVGRDRAGDPTYLPVLAGDEDLCVTEREIAPWSRDYRGGGREIGWRLSDQLSQPRDGVVGDGLSHVVGVHPVLLHAPGISYRCRCHGTTGDCT